MESALTASRNRRMMSSPTQKLWLLPKHEALYAESASGLAKYTSSHVPELQSIGVNVPGPASEKILYSTHRCTGNSWSKARGEQTCRFNNVCFNNTSGVFQYFVDPGEALGGGALFYDYNASAHTDLPSDFVSLGHKSASPKIMPWAPQAVYGQIPVHSSGRLYAASPVAVYAAANDFAYNLGHAMFDFMFPVFNVMQLFQLYTPEFQLLLAEHQGNDEGALTRFVNPDSPEKSVLRLLSRRRAVKPVNLQRRSGSAGLTCYRTLVAGTYAMHTPEARLRALPFRSAAIASLGIQTSALPAKPKILVLEKKGRRRIENTREIVTELTKFFPGVNIDSISGIQLEQMPIKQQVEIISSASILITPCGGLGTALIFLPPGATAIVMNHYDTIAQTSVQMDEMYYHNIEYLDFQYFPVLKEDYTGTSDRPQCEKEPTDDYFNSQGALIHCNVRIKNIRRLTRMVRRALQRLHAERQ